MTKSDDGRSLFDDIDMGPEEKCGIQPVIAPIEASNGFNSRQAPPSSWHEVPAARFSSWTAAEQFAYCRDRDLDSAERAESEWWREFYIDRALWYDGQVNDGQVR